jgi:hypothetical protein
MATMTLTACANAAAQFLGVLNSGESLSAQEIADALSAANNLMDNWSSEQVMLLQLVETTQTLTAATQKYTIGTSQTWNMTRPAAIASASLINSTGPGIPIDVVNAVKWSSIPDRQAQSYLVKYLYYDRGFPTGNVYVAPTPLGSTLSVQLVTWSPLSPFADATTPLTMLPGYARLLQLALAIEIAPQYEVAPTQTLMQNYADAMARVRHLNAELIGSEPPSGDVSAASGAPVAPNQGAQ